jgi:UDP-glucose 4-epimerase
MAVCLVTGGAGFIGSHLVEALVARGHTVRVLDDFSTGSLANLEGVRSRIELVRGSVTDLRTVREAARGVEVIFHQAALGCAPRNQADLLTTHAVCTTGTLHVLIAAREAEVRRVVYSSSSSAYGDASLACKLETDRACPVIPSEVAKFAGEQYCVAFTHLYGLETVRLRYFNVYGPRQLSGGPNAAVIPVFLEAMLAGRRPMIFGDGLQTRDFIYVGDVVQGNLLAATATRVAGKVYNIASGRRTNLLELVQQINELLGTSIPPLHGERQLGDVRHSYASISRAQTELGFCPCIDLEQGLRLCLSDYRNRPTNFAPVNHSLGVFPGSAEHMAAQLPLAAGGSSLARRARSRGNFRSQTKKGNV